MLTLSVATPIMSPSVRKLYLDVASFSVLQNDLQYLRIRVRKLEILVAHGELEKRKRPENVCCDGFAEYVLGVCVAQRKSFLWLSYRNGRRHPRNSIASRMHNP